MDDGSGIKQVNGEPGQLETLSSDKVVAKKNGYVYVYTSNESQQDVLFDNMGVMQITGPVLEETHYYPFGLTMSAISNTAPLKLENRFKFNGKELNHKEFSDNSGIEWYDYGARMYDPQIGRWGVIDPLTEKYLNISPYGYVANNPISAIDPDGMQILTDFINFENGKRTHLEDGKDQVIAVNNAQSETMQSLFINDRDAYNKQLTTFEKTKNNLHVTVGKFNDLSGVIYAESSNSATWQEAGGIYGVLNNRAKADGTSIFEEANAPGVYGAKEKDKIFSKYAKENKVSAVYKGIALSRMTGIDLSNGGYYWQGNDFYREVPWSRAYERFYLTGFRFTNPSHDIWGIGNHLSGQKAYNYKYESTAAYGETTFIRLTNEWLKANHASRWDGR